VSSPLTPPWKFSFNPSGAGPFLVKVKLVDLMYSNAATLTPYPTGTGFKLPHDILVYNPAIYSVSSGNLQYLTTADSGYVANENDRRKYGIFLVKPKFNPSAKVTIVPFTLNGIQGQYAVYESGASEELQEDDYFSQTQNSRPNLYNFFSSSQLAAGDYFASSASLAEDSSPLASTCSVILANPDNTLRASLPGSQLVPYTQMRLNLSSASIVDIVAWATDASTALAQAPGFLDPAQNPALAQAEIWIRCSFFADYVDPKSSAQDLAQGSNVQHKNLIVGQGDYVKYEDTNVSTPYLPVTPPLSDMGPTSGLVTDNAFPAPARSGAYPSLASNIPAGWFDPTDSTRNGMPAVPAEGNIYASGRLFSITIDEIVTTLKALISGRPADPTTLPTTQDTTGIYAFATAATASKQTPTDTRLPAERAISLAGGKLGDPLSRDGSVLINAPEGIFYYVNDRLKVIADKITTTAGVRIEDVAPVASKVLYTAGFWAPRATPLSLRELEAMLLGVAYNLETAFNFLALNKASVGPTDTSAHPYGTLHQLHTAYDQSLDDSDPNSKWITTANTNFTVFTATTYGNNLPSSAPYDPAVDHLREDVYLAADGTWRYLFDTVRLPILTETY